MKYVAAIEDVLDYKLEGYYKIPSKVELDKVVCNNRDSISTVVLLPDFVNEYFTPSGLVSYITNTAKVNNKLIFDTSRIGALTSVTEFSKKLHSAKTVNEVLLIACKYEKEFMDTLGYLTSEDTEYQNSLLNLEARINSMQNELHSKEIEIEALRHQVKNEQDVKLNLSNRLSSLVSKINYQYNINLNPNELFTLNKNSYNKILYIKELTRVQYVDSLVYYLKEILSVLYGMPTRVCVIESEYASGKVSQYRDFVPMFRMKERDILQRDRKSVV